MITSMEVERRWAALDRSNNSLPLFLKPAQRDAIMNIMNGKHVLLNVTTGYGKTLAELCCTILSIDPRDCCLFIAPLVVIETQCEQVLQSWGIPWLSLTHTTGSLTEAVAAMNPPPRVLLTSISRVATKEVQEALRQLPIKVVAVDEVQVADPDPDSGWSEFLPYNEALWNFLCAALQKAVFLLCTATLNDRALRNIRGVLEIPRRDLVLLFRNCTRHNLFLQVRKSDLRKTSDLDNMLSFLIPILMDESRPKVQIFLSGHKLRHNLVCAFLKAEARRIGGTRFTDSEVQKLNGDLRRSTKTEVLESFKTGEYRCLCSTDAGGMGSDVRDINLTVVVGEPSTSWKLAQQVGRTARDNTPGAVVVFSSKSGMGCKEIRKACNKGCVTANLAKLFTLTLSKTDGKI